MANKQQRCKACGKVLEDADKALCITKGKMAGVDFSPAKAWGILHDECFMKAVNLPEVMMRQIQQLAQGRTPGM